MNDKISENAVWENGLTTDEPNYTPVSQPIQHIQSQMMFCYSCNGVIPGDSVFCPWCQTELYAKCPQCGNKYSSQYPSCNQCGTNRKEYMITQQLMQIEQAKKRKEAAEKNRLEKLKKKEEELEAKNKQQLEIRKRGQSDLEITVEKLRLQREQKAAKRRREASKQRKVETDSQTSLQYSQHDGDNEWVIFVVGIIVIGILILMSYL